MAKKYKQNPLKDQTEQDSSLEQNTGREHSFLWFNFHVVGFFFCVSGYLNVLMT